MVSVTHIVSASRSPNLSIVCVYNDPKVMSECLDRSLNEYFGAVTIEALFIDNTEHQYSSAGAALNQGARAATGDVVVFVHQDVFIHSVDRLAEVAELLMGESSWGVLGACGVTPQATWTGRLRDRVELLGRSSRHPTEVESLDEVLFMVRRDRVRGNPLTEDTDLSWHAYAVEYSLRMRKSGLRVGAVDVGITHNSLTVNLDRLDVAHQRIATSYPENLPVHTTCGIVRDRSFRLNAMPVLGRHAWRLRRLKSFLAAARVLNQLPDGVPVVVADIRRDVDHLHWGTDFPLRVLNVDADGSFARYGGQRLSLLRRKRLLEHMAVPTVAEAIKEVKRLPPQQSVLVTNLDFSDMATISECFGTDSAWLVGVHDGNTWLLGGPAASRPPAEWRFAPSGAWGLPLKPQVSG